MSQEPFRVGRVDGAKGLEGRIHVLTEWANGFRSLCGGLTSLERGIEWLPFDLPTCGGCQGKLGNAMEDGLKVSGQEPDLTPEEYMKLFVRSANVVVKMDPETLVDHIERLRQASIRIKVATQAAKKTLEERRITLKKEQRDALKLREMSYKPKATPKEVDPSAPKKARKSPGTGLGADAIETVMKMYGITREKAEKRMKKIEDRLAAAEVLETGVVPPEPTE